ncbi:MAG: acetolactate synthase [marine bacterium B5-7]|nr:MAG: acetolactate synthase [marine bacterium B5-7]
MIAAEVIARRLALAGVKEAYGIPGGEVLTFVNSLADAGIRFVLCKHENAGGFMAEGAYHASGAPGVLVATLGPGVANAVNVMANALQDRVPMLLITGCVDSSEAATYTHQVFDHGALLSCVTKATMTIADGAVDVMIDKALAIAMQDPPGPVHLDLPISVAHKEQKDPAYQIEKAMPLRGTPRVGESLETASKWLAEARRPIIIAGLEVLYQGAEEAVSAFVKTNSVPLITTYKAKGILDEEHPLSLGAAGLSPKADDLLLPLVSESDCIILAGYDPIEMRSGWKNPWPEDARVIEFSAVPNVHYMHHSRFEFIGDIGAGLEALTKCVTDLDIVVTDNSRPSPKVDDAVVLIQKKLASYFGAGLDDWGPRAVIDVARSVLPRNTVATVDSGAHRILLSQMWTCYTPRTLLQSTGLCTMGCALPMATGYKRLNPQTPVAAFMGDGCLEMVLGELATLRDSGLPVTVIVFVDESLALIELKQRKLNYQNVGVDFTGTDLAAVAEAMGGRGVTVDTRDSLVSAINESLDATTFTLIACIISRKAYDGLF